ncbi:hypothetical protein F5Y17DRAFT_459175 [Xylariaceae sp. FL0594]|nr:hypothetical protein F5Y17DRAFT_459175 [Xylariaceae sp. FL0594]
MSSDTFRETPPRRAGGLASDMPSPLHIVKRMKTVEFRSNTKRDISSDSVEYDPERPLCVRKRRQHSETATAVTSNAYIYQDEIFKTDHELGSQPVQHKRPVFRPSGGRPPNSEAVRRWFSKSRHSSSSSSSSTCRRYNLRSDSMASNGSSLGPPSSSGQLDDEPTLDPSGRCSSVQRKASFAGASLQSMSAVDCHILIPQISVTSEVQISCDAVTTVWAAIEISGQLSCPYHTTQDQSIQDRLHMPNPLRPGSVARFGRLREVDVGVLPVERNTVLEVIQDRKDKSLSLGTTILVLARVEIAPRQRSRKARYESLGMEEPDELITDIQSQLSGVDIAYMQIRLRYQHSGFATSNTLGVGTGITNCQTQLETTAIGAIEQNALYNPPWSQSRTNLMATPNSRRPRSPFTAASITRFDGLREPTPSRESRYQELVPYEPAPESPPIWSPRSSYRREEQEDDEEGERRAREIWTDIRRKSSRSNHTSSISTRIHNANHRRTRGETTGAELGVPSINANSGGRVSLGTGVLSSHSVRNMRSEEVDLRREHLRSKALRNQRSIGSDSLKSLVPSVMALDIGSNSGCGYARTGSTNKENTPPTHYSSVGSTMTTTTTTTTATMEQKKEARWSLAGLW